MDNENYKTSSLNYENEYERKKYEITNEYGYDFSSNKRRKINERKYAKINLNNVNKDFLINKR